jgi:hypothetical protein
MRADALLPVRKAPRNGFPVIRKTKPRNLLQQEKYNLKKVIHQENVS